MEIDILLLQKEKRKQKKNEVLFHKERERDLVSAVKKDAWIVWFGHGLKQNRSDWRVSMRPACMQQ